MIQRPTPRKSTCLIHSHFPGKELTNGHCQLPGGDADEFSRMFKKEERMDFGGKLADFTTEFVVM